MVNNFRDRFNQSMRDNKNRKRVEETMNLLNSDTFKNNAKALRDYENRNSLLNTMTVSDNTRVNVSPTRTKKHNSPRNHTGISIRNSYKNTIKPNTRMGSIKDHDSVKLKNALKEGIGRALTEFDILMGGKEKEIIWDNNDTNIALDNTKSKKPYLVDVRTNTARPATFDEVKKYGIIEATRRPVKAIKLASRMFRGTPKKQNKTIKDIISVRTKPNIINENIPVTNPNATNGNIPVPNSRSLVPVTRPNYKAAFHKALSDMTRSTYKRINYKPQDSFPVIYKPSNNNKLYSNILKTLAAGTASSYAGYRYYKHKNDDKENNPSPVQTNTKVVKTNAKPVQAAKPVQTNTKVVKTNNKVVKTNTIRNNINTTRTNTKVISNNKNKNIATNTITNKPRSVATNKPRNIKRNRVKMQSVVKTPIINTNNSNDKTNYVDLKSIVKPVNMEVPKHIIDRPINRETPKYIIDKPINDSYENNVDSILQQQLNSAVDNYINNRKKKVLGGEDKIGMKKVDFEYTPLPKKPNIKIEQPAYIRPIYPIEYKTPVRNVFTDFYNNMTTEDKISTASNVLGSAISFGLNKASVNKIKAPEKPVTYKANRLKTNINVNPQINNINESQAAYERDIDNNSSNSNVALARKQSSRLNNRTAINSIYGNKYNTETELINKNRINQQEIDNNNIKEYNTWRNNVDNVNNSKNQMNAENNISLASNVNAAIQDNISKQEQRKKDEQDRLSTIAAYPNVNPRILKDLGVKIPNDVILAWERNYRNKLNKVN